MAIEALVVRLTVDAGDRRDQAKHLERDEAGRLKPAPLDTSAQRAVQANEAAEALGIEPASQKPVGQTFVQQAAPKSHTEHVAQQLAETFGTNRTYVNGVKKIKETRRGRLLPGKGR